MRRADDTPKDVTARALVPFFALTFALTWAAGGVLVLVPDTMTAIFGAPPRREQNDGRS